MPEYNHSSMVLVTSQQCIRLFGCLRGGWEDDESLVTMHYVHRPTKLLPALLHSTTRKRACCNCCASVTELRAVLPWHERCKMSKSTRGTSSGHRTVQV